MALHIYNSLTRQKEKFKPIRDKHISIYTCGPTVYNYLHIGNYRTYMTWDLVVRTLRFLDYRVQHVMNITDVGHLTGDEEIANEGNEDKMEKAAKRENKTVWDIARFYEEDFVRGMGWLHIKGADTLCRATEHIPEMIAMIETLVQRGFAYVTPSGVYYEIAKFPEYGKLSGNTVEQLEDGASGRVEQIADKRSPNDFVLWVTGKEQSMMWDSPWGRGYPGWHIECSAMSRRYLGDRFDIHGGGIDNKFPHHECEIAQSEAAIDHRKAFAHTWMHTGHINVNGQKMAKSAGGFFTLHDLKEKGIPMRVFRMLCLSAHYRSAMEFSWTSLDQAKASLTTFDRFQERLERVTLEGMVRPEFNEILNSLIQEVMEALEDDFNTPAVFAQLFTWMKEMNGYMDEDNLYAVEAQAVQRVLETIDDALGVILPWPEEQGSGEVPAAVQELFEARKAARAAKDWAKSDDIRDQLKEAGYEVEDTKDGAVLRKIS